MIVDDFQGKRILVIGDVMLDHFVRGSVERVSPEAPALILRVHEDQWCLGGAGNVAANVVSLGGEAALVGLVGRDDAARRIDVILAESPGLVNCLVVCDDWPTIEKTRFIAGDNHLLRADRERREIPAEAEGLAIAAIERNLAEGCDGVVLSDYAKGLMTPCVIAFAVAESGRMGIPLVADPKRPNFSDYRGCTVLTPNRKELGAVAGHDCRTDAEIDAAMRVARKQVGESAIILTRSEQGISLFRSQGPAYHEPARAREVRDVSGAGDTVAAVVALALAGGADLRAATMAANVAAGVVVGKGGTSTASAPELIAAMLQTIGHSVLEDKLATLRSARKLRRIWASQGKRVGFTNGCFDIVHPGHVRLLRAAHARCDKLIVALNTDASVRRLKGEDRPVQSEAARADVIAAMEAVDLVLLFDEDTPLEIIRALEPDILFKGADYTVEQVVGHDVVEASGGQVELIDLVAGHSTTNLLQKSRDQSAILSLMV